MKYASQQIDERNSSRLVSFYHSVGCRSTGKQLDFFISAIWIQHELLQTGGTTEVIMIFMSIVETYDAQTM